MRKLIAVAVVSLLLVSFGAAGAIAAPNPSPTGTGQPGAECGDPGATIEPAGFTKPGFQIAEAHYANKDGTHAVSQYDVACFQVPSNHPGG
jgi:hypothetical protein